MHDTGVVGQFTGRLINFKTGERVGILACRQKPLPRRINIEIAWCRATDLFAFDE